MANLKPVLQELRRRSVDVGGLALALSATNNDSGAGWGGWETAADAGADADADVDDERVRYAELLSDMYTSTQTAVNYHLLEHLPLPSGSAETRGELIDSLDTWHFEPHKLPEGAVLACTILLFEALLRTKGMVKDVGFSVEQLAPFLRHLRGIYRQENSYHNFQHALDVLQATHMFLSAAGVVPPVSILAHADNRTWIPDRAGASPLVACLSNSDLFALYVAAIGHDVGHPGFSNVFMKNAKTPLSAVYNDQSALEQMHCALLLRVMRAHGLGRLLDAPMTGPLFRSLLLQTVLATDMSVHAQFMRDFDAYLAAPPPAASGAALQRQKLFVCKALIKCADISNPCRPRGVARHWAHALMAEWTAQAALERALRLPSTVNPSAEPLAEAKSQVFFIGTFAGPLFALTARGIPELAPYAKEGASNLEWWAARRDRLVDGRAPDTPPGGRAAAAAAAVAATPSRPRHLSDASEDDDDDTALRAFSSAFSLTLPPLLRQSEPNTPLPSSPAMSPGTEPDAGGGTPTFSSVFDEPPPSPLMPGAWQRSPPAPLARALSSPPPSPRTVAPSTPPGRLHISTTFPPQAGPLPTPPPDGPPGLHVYAHSHTRTSSGASVASALSAFSGTTASGGGGNSAIRAAMKASMRKKTSQHFHRASWNPAAAPPLPQMLYAPGAGASAASSTRTSPVVRTFADAGGRRRPSPAPPASGPALAST